MPFTYTDRLYNPTYYKTTWTRGTPGPRMEDRPKHQMRWTTEMDAAFSFPGFAPDHLTTRREKTPSSYSPEEFARGDDGGSSVPHTSQGSGRRTHSMPQSATASRAASRPATPCASAIIESVSSLQMGAQCDVDVQTSTRVLKNAATDMADMEGLSDPHPAPAHPGHHRPGNAPSADKIRLSITPPLSVNGPGRNDRRRKPKPPRHWAADAPHLVGGREQPDSRYIPAFHNYGWKNVHPVVDKRYMNTFNTQPRDRRQIYPHTRTRRAMAMQYGNQDGSDSEHGETTCNSPSRVHSEVKLVFVRRMGGVGVPLHISESSTEEEVMATLRGILLANQPNPLSCGLLLTDKHGREVRLRYHSIDDGETFDCDIIHPQEKPKDEAVPPQPAPPAPRTLDTRLVDPKNYRGTPHLLHNVKAAGVRTRTSEGGVADCLRIYD